MNKITVPTRVLVFIHIIALLFVVYSLYDWITCWGGSFIGCNAVGIFFFIPAFILGILPTTWKHKLLGILIFISSTLILEILSFPIKKAGSLTVDFVTDYQFTLSEIGDLMQLTMVGVVIGFLLGWSLYIILAKLMSLISLWRNKI